ncbi:sulfite exporter TauE/SafE family protein [Actomonas aquatica]|uniref:Probable membrane transporter protein n=1 Tax=Actomonas aquatica TaxID=2866162 RepID=A0ABZ1CEM1_9BACT|nr:sulfite exporter TauE/SafE family protein [Opitutus sp. WL0086]WRQ90115.1 sulfite exporter TauE/SafE family protein [Opitutus sp. WL0086]
MTLLLVLVALSALVQGLSGFGFGMLGMALLSPVIGYRDALALLVVLNLFINFCNLAFHGLRFSWQGTGGVIGGLAVGVPAGMFLVTLLDERILFVLLGVFLVYAAGTFLWRKLRGGPVPGVGNAWLAGGLSGFFGGGFNAGGPPLVNHCFRGDEPFFECKKRFAAMVFLMSVYRLVLSGPAGLHLPVGWGALAGLCGAVLVGFSGGFFLSRKVNSDQMKNAVYGFLLLLGAYFVITFGGRLLGD